MTEPDHRLVGQHVALAVLLHRRVAAEAVGDGVDEQLEGQRRAALVAGGDGGDGGQVGAGAVTADGDPRPVGADRGGVFGQPAGDLEARLGRSRKLVLGRQRIVHAGDQDPRLDAEVTGGRVGRGQVADAPSRRRGTRRAGGGAVGAGAAAGRGGRAPAPWRWGR